MKNQNFYSSPCYGLHEFNFVVYVYKTTLVVFDIYIYVNYFTWRRNIHQIVLKFITYATIKSFFVKNVNMQIYPLGNKCFKFMIKTFKKDSNFFYNENLRTMSILVLFIVNFHLIWNIFLVFLTDIILI